MICLVENPHEMNGWRGYLDLINVSVIDNITIINELIIDKNLFKLLNQLQVAVVLKQRLSLT